MAYASGARWRAIRDRIAGGIRLLGKLRSDSIADVGRSAREAARAASNADYEAQHHVALLTGYTVSGASITFRASEVWSLPLVDANNAPIGAIFDPVATVVKAALRWAAHENREADLMVRPARRDTADRYEIFPAEDAPWAAGVRNAEMPPNYFIAHGLPDGFVVAISNEEGEPKPKFTHVKLTGQEYGRLLSAHETAQRAIKRNPSGEQVFVSCSTANPRGDAARSAAEYMHQSNVVTGPIYAPINEVVIPSVLDESSQSQIYAITQPDTLELFKTFRPPNDNADADR